ncbi:MAG: 3-oxoadipate enol-lactonase [Rhodospirillales bacterium]
MATEIVARMAVEIEGQGPDVVLLHGLGGSSNSFTPQMSVFAGRYRSLRPDLPGSARSALPDSLTMEGLVAAILAMTEALGVTRAHFVGHSLGTILCQHIALAAPKQVASLALFGPLTAPPPAAREALAKRAEMARGGGLAAMAEIGDAIVKAATASATKERQPGILAAVRESVMRQSAAGYGATCAALAAAEAADASRIACPTLLVTGEDDVVAPPSVTRELAEKVGGARAHILPRCGHWTTLEAAEEVNRLLKEFLSAQR